MVRLCDVITITLLVTFTMTLPTFARDRNYYLAINEIIWDYAPTGVNHVTGNLLEDDGSLGPIGSRYKKAVFRRYTDDSYTREIPHDPNLGFLGPTLRAEVGDRIFIHLLNNATTRPFSVHPHGVFYTKENEGAPYGNNADNIPGNHVPPGGRHTYEWEVKPEYGPTEDDGNCLTWAYHSHTHSPKDINSGLIGALIICKPGTYNDDDTRDDVSHEFVALFFSISEMDSWYFEDNIQMFISNWQTFKITDEFLQSTVLNTVNGYVFGNTPGYDVCIGDKVDWFLLGMGSDRDLHPIHFQGQTILHKNHRQDTLILIPATFTTVTMTADNSGRWKVACQLYSHETEGMIAYFTVSSNCSSKSDESTPLNRIVREYFILAEEVLWDYAPTGIDQLTGENITEPGSDSAVFFKSGPNRIGGTYKKARYSGYTDDTFTQLLLSPPHLGILGPVISGEVGDTIRVTFRNNATHPFNIEPHGVFFSEIEAVNPGGQHTYTWTIPPSVSPTDQDPNCLTYLYFSSVHFTKDQLAGLIGPLVVCKKGTYDSEMSKPNIYLLLTVFNENESWYFDENLDLFVPDQTNLDVSDPDFEESNIMHAINGKMYGNLFGVEMCVHENTSFHTLSVGTDTDMHAIRFDGIASRIQGVNTGVVDLFPHISRTVVITPVYPGKGRVSCRLDDHILGGMTTFYHARDCSNITNQDNINSDDTDTNNDITDTNDDNIRQYYIAAEEVIWDYNERQLNVFNQPIHVNEDTAGYLHAFRIPGQTIGSKYKKAVFVEYTDETFTQKVPKPIHLGFMGPIIKGEVGDKIKILFLNNASKPYNMFPWGAVDPSSLIEGDVGVEPGTSKEYNWIIPPEAGPKPDQPSCQSFVYISVVNRVTDPVAGLIGPLLVCAKGGSNLQEIDAEFFLLFYIVDENLSPYLDENIRTFVGVEPSEFEITEQFEESNKMKAINGHLSHVPGLIMRENWLVRWHLIGWGSETDFHSIHFHAHTYIHVSSSAYRGDVFSVYPGFVGTVDMVTVAPGDWLLHCHVFDHMEGGMETTYKVLKNVEQDFCRMDSISSTTLYCDHVTMRKNLIPEGFMLTVQLDDGNTALISTKNIEKLDLSYNNITTPLARRILHFFPGLVSVNFQGNNLRNAPGHFLINNPNVLSLILSDNNLFGVSRQLLDFNNSEQFYLQLSANPALKKSCLNRLFMEKTSFLECFKTRKN